MTKVRMFCDWDNDSRELIERLKQQTIGFGGDDVPADQYNDILFVDNDNYDVAMVFNYTDRDFGVPTISLILEPPEIYHVRDNPPGVKTYSFCDDGHEPAYGIGFATCSWDSYLNRNNCTDGVAMIVSNKMLTPWHHRRHEIKEALLRSGLPIDFYGRGMQPSSDSRIKGEIAPMRKADILTKYSMVIDFENSPRNALTDKFFDPVLCRTKPVSNCRWIYERYPDEVGFVDFDDELTSIVERIASLFDLPRSTFGQCRKSYYDITQGSLCLAKWIEDRVKEL